MDFSTLTRRELQALCKNNGIPANITNVAMADSLQALEHVEGLEDLLNQSPEKTMIGSVSAARTAGRTTTGRKLIKEPESSQPLTSSRRGRRTVTEEMDQEKNEVPKTPVAPSTWRRAPPVSARQKTETASVQSVYNTRRSVRLLEKNMSKLNLDNENSMSLRMDELSTDINNCSEKSDGSVDKGSDMQTASEMSSDRVDISEVQSERKPNGPVEENGGKLKVGNESYGVGNDMIEVGNDFKPKPELESEVAGSNTTLDVTVVTEGMDESYGEGTDETKEMESYDEGTENSLASKVSDVSAEVMNLETAAQSSLLQGVKESMSEEKATETNLQALTVNLSGEHQGIAGSKSSATYGADSDYNEKFDFELDSVTEEESSEDETTDGNPIECSKGSGINGKKGEFDESDSMTEVDSDGSITEDECGEDDSDDSTTDEDEEEASDDEMPRSAKLATNEETNQVAKMQESNNSEAAQALAAEQIANQFPRPTLSKHGKSAGNKQLEIFDDDEENIGSNDKDVEMKKAGDTTNKEGIAQMSLRQLKKMLKNKMKIGDDKTKMEEKPRTALQEVPENQVAVNKAGK